MRTGGWEKGQDMEGTKNLFSEKYSRKLPNPGKERASTNKSNVELQITCLGKTNSAPL